jgi:integrase
MFGLSPLDIDVDQGEVNVCRQVKLYQDGRMAFAPPKGGKTRTVPLADAVRHQLKVHLDAFPAQPVTLPWGDPDNEPVTVPLVVTNQAEAVVNRNTFNRLTWRPALTAAGIELVRENGCHALRHHFASVLLDAGESIKAVSEYLGHADAGFTLRTYTHLMPSSGERTRRAIDASWAGAMDVPSGEV